MKYERLQATLDRSLATASMTERRVLRIIATLAAALAVGLPIVQFIEIDRLLNPNEPSLWGVIISYTSFWVRVRIGVALTVSSIAIWPFRSKPFLVATLAMAWAMAEYLLWLSWSIRVKESLGIGRLPEPSVGGLYTANWLDLIVPIFALVIVAWILKIFASLRASSARLSE